MVHLILKFTTAFLLTTLLLPDPAHFDDEESAIELWYPKGNAVIVRTGMGGVVGAFEENVASVQLLRELDQHSSLPLQRMTQKDVFAKSIRDLFPAHCFLRSIAFAFTLSNGKQESRSLTATLEAPIDLKAFWESDFFKAVYAFAYQKSVFAVEVDLQIWSGPVLDVGSEAYRDRYMNKFAFSPALEPGRNVFHLRALDPEGNVLHLDSLQFFMQSDAASESDAGFTAEPLHSPEQEEFCGGCHTMVPDDATIQNQGEVKEICSACHTPLVSQTSSHSPAAEWECLMCHDANSSPRYSLYTDQTYDAEFCMQCHPDIQERTEMQSPHAAAQMSCINCHDAHGSSRRKLLKGDVKPLCASCHEDAAATPHPVNNHPLAGAADPLVEGRPFSCASCHDPHGSNEAKLLREPFTKMCRACHKIW
ncbi:MAG: cytochrome c3 family protein [Bacteroidetes bacterium]|nr:cytochrome c3 family protein [Bacteroidota bacterium]